MIRLDTHPLSPKAVDVLGMVLVTFGRSPTDIRYTGWQHVWVHEDGTRRVTAPKGGLRPFVDPETKMYWYKVQQETFIPYD